MKRTLLILTAMTALVLAACQTVAPDAAQPASNPVLTLAAHDSFSIGDEVLSKFEEDHGVELRVLTLGDAGEALNKIILSKDAPLADIFYGVDNTFLSRALSEDIFVPYESPALSSIPHDLKLDDQFRLTPVDFGYVNINADKAWFEDAGIALPQTLEDLAEPEYRDLFVVENPATSSPGLAFLLTTVAHFGEDGYLDYWQALLDNGVLVTSGWSEAYYEHFTVGSGGSGDRPLVVSYSTSPPADVVYASDERTEPASVNVSPDDGTFRQVEFVGVLKGASQPELAQAFVDYMLSTEFQEDIPLNMFVYPANQDAALPEVFVQFGQTPTSPVDISPDAIEASRETWINAWTDLVMR